MKTARLTIVLAALVLTAGFARAQNEDPVPVPAPALPAPPALPDEALAEREIARATGEAKMRRAERNLTSMQRALQVAQARAEDANRVYATSVSRGFPRSGSAGRALIIPKAPTDPKTLGEMEEDMNVMAHILDKAASEGHKSERAMGIPVFGRYSWGGSAPQNLFIEGSGALFFLNVDYPLQPAPDKDANAETKAKPASEWDEAKKEMAGSRGGGGNTFAFEEFDHTFVWESGSSSPYDADQVDALKTDLIAALKNVANIRRLKPDEMVTVVVTGANARAGGKRIKATGGKRGQEERVVEERVVEAVASEAGDRAPAPAPAKLVLRVRKSDAEAFQNGKLSLDDFKKKVAAMIY